tara:strand:+ start:4086 stop:4619 length:534 start_codon:yes stop_codon:yes gene_type:complete
MEFKNTKNKLKEVGFILKKGLQDELAAQRHNATGRLSRGIRASIIGRHELADFENLTLSMMSSVSYWEAVNNPKFATVPNIETIKRWVSVKGLPARAAYPILKKLKGFYGEPYAYWTEGNNLRRTNFAGYVANKFSKKIANKLAPAIGKDVAEAIGEYLKRNNKDVTLAGKNLFKSL